MTFIMVNPWRRNGQAEPRCLSLRVRLMLAMLLVSAFLSGCSVSPTGRNQLTLYSEDTMAQQGSQSFEEMKQQLPISQDTKINRNVQCVAEALLKTAELKPAEWEIVVFDQSDTVNAFALPGRKIGVYTGLLDVAKTDDQLAAVVGHEIGHVLAHHGNERVSTTMITQAGLAVLLIGLQTQDMNSPELTAALTGGAQIGIILPFSRAHESEADTIGLLLMARAGFDPKASVVLWQNMSKAGGDGPPQFLSTHPSNESRIEGLESHMDEAMALYREAAHHPQCPAR